MDEQEEVEVGKLPPLEPLECRWCDTEWRMLQGSHCPICGDLLVPRTEEVNK